MKIYSVPEKHCNPDHKQSSGTVEEIIQELNDENIQIWYGRSQKKLHFGRAIERWVRNHHIAKIDHYKKDKKHHADKPVEQKGADADWFKQIGGNKIRKIERADRKRPEYNEWTETSNNSTDILFWRKLPKHQILEP